MKFHGAFFKRPTSKIKQAKIYFILNSSPKIPKGGPPKSAECASIELSNQRFCYWNIEFYVSDWTKPKLSNISNKYASMFRKLSLVIPLVFLYFRCLDLLPFAWPSSQFHSLLWQHVVIVIRRCNVLKNHVTDFYCAIHHATLCREENWRVWKAVT